ncbi:MAG: hypothetical protein FJW40_26795 [Acidobacteria bacterium]|nr:hypothetical protein [Acidobacteriota bacterium]
MRWLFPFLLFSALAAAQTSEYEGKQTITLSSGKIDLKIFEHGGAMASLVLTDDPERMDPIWNPARLARESGDAPRFGYSFGHFVCVDGFGPVSDDERRAGTEGHGEAHRLPWERLGLNATSASYRVTLPVHQERLTRSYTVAPGGQVVLVESEIESLLAFDRPLVWAEHGTIGSPFLTPETTVVDMSGTEAKTRPYSNRGNATHRLQSGVDFTWPMAPTVGGQTVDVRSAPAKLGSGDHTTTKMDPSQRLAWVTAIHTGKNLVFGYLFRREEFPWVQSWENYPAHGKLARGLEFSTMPFDVPRRDAITQGRMFGVPTFRWLPAKGKASSKFLMFYARVPAGFKKVDSVTQEGGKITVVDRGANLRVTLDVPGEI